MTQGPRPNTAEQIINNLHNFNRKERDHLMKFALSNCPSHPQISDKLWSQVASDLPKAERPNQKSIFVGMDYHLNWLYAALSVSNAYDPNGMHDMANSWPDSSDNDGYPKERPLRDNKEDVDLLIAIPLNSKKLRLVIVEAKLGSGWSSTQFKSKIERLEAIRKASSETLPPELDIEWRLMLASPNASPPSNNAFSPEKLNDQEGWYTETRKGRVRPRYFQFGPPQVFQVKRDSESGKKWEIIRVNLAGKAQD